MVDKEEARRRVRVAVKGEMGRRGWNIQQLIDASGLDRSTLGDFLDGKRWPQSRTLGAVEKALGWPVSSIALMLEGGDPPVGGDPAPESAAGPLLTEATDEELAAEVLRRMTPHGGSTRGQRQSSEGPE
jgi:predicted DNA-binding transcriptional regulator AlpA